MRGWVSIGVLVGLRGGAIAEPAGFVDADVGFGAASINTSQGVCGSYGGPSGTLALVRAGLGGGMYVNDNLAVVGRAHATDAFPSPHALAFALFAGAGLQLRIGKYARPRDYVYVEIVPGYEVSSTPEVGNNAGLGIAARVGIYSSALSLALAATLQLGSGSRDYAQSDLALVVGLHF